MSTYQRPWWLVVNKPPGLITIVQEESSPAERIFIIRGEPMVQGLAWLTWGPVGSVFTILLLTQLAVTFHVRGQAGMIQALFIGAFLGLPALVWGGLAVVLNRLSQKHLVAERQAEAQECIVHLRQNQGVLFYRTTIHPTGESLPYNHIQSVRIAQAIGDRSSKTLYLVLDTNNGPIVLLNEKLGTRTQKTDLAREIESTMKAYSNKQKSPFQI